MSQAQSLTPDQLFSSPSTPGNATKPQAQPPRLSADQLFPAGQQQVNKPAGLSADQLFSSGQQQQPQQQTPFVNPLQKLFPQSPLQANGLLANAVTNARQQIEQAGVAPQGLPASAMTISQLPYYQSQAAGATNQRAQQQQDIAAAQQNAAAQVAQDAAAHPVTGRLEELGKGTTGAIQSGLARLVSQVAPQAGEAMRQGIQVQNPAVGITGKTGAVLGSLELPVATGAINPIAGISELTGEGIGGARQEVAGLREQGKQISGAQEAGQALLQGGIQGGAGFLFGRLGKVAGDLISSLDPAGRAAIAAGDSTLLQRVTQQALQATGKSVSGATVNHVATVAGNLIRQGVDPSVALSQGWLQNDLIGAVLPHAFEHGTAAPGEIAPGEAPAANASEARTATMPESAPAPNVAPERTGAENFQPRPAQQPPSPAVAEPQTAQPIQPPSATPPAAEAPRTAAEPDRLASMLNQPEVKNEGATQATPEVRPLRPGEQMDFGHGLEQARAAKSAAISGEPLPGEPEHADRIAQQEHDEAGIDNRHKGIVAIPDVNLTGPGSIVQEEVKPVLQKVGDFMGQFGKLFPVEREDLMSTLKGKAPDDLAQLSFRKEIIGATNEHLAAMQDLKNARKIFSTMPADQQHDFQAAMYDGNVEHLPENLRDVAKQMYAVTNSRRQAIADLFEGKQLGRAASDWSENWWNQLWKKDPNARPLIEKINRPGQLGSKAGAGLLQGRTLSDFQSGIEKGLKPAYDNPVEMFAATDALQRQWLAAGRSVKALDELGEVRRIDASEDVPPGHTDITDVLPKSYRELVSGDPKSDGERIIASNQTADIIRNVITPSAFSKGVLRGPYELARKVSNIISQSILGISGFHVKKIALEGILLDAARTAAKGTSLRGEDLLQPAINAPLLPRAMRGKAIQEHLLGIEPLKNMTPTTARVMDALKGSMSAEPDAYYKNAVLKNLKNAWKESDFVQGAIRAGARIPAAALETFAQDGIFKIVQHSKLAYGFDSLNDFIKANPEASPVEIERAAAKISDNADRVLGLMQRDALFWNKSVRDVLSLAFLSTSWQYGTLRSFAGAVREGAEATRIAPALRKMFGQGYEPQKSTSQNRQQLSYWLTTAGAIGLLGAVKTYLHTGHGPQQLVDYIYPSTGRKDDQGRDIRDHGVSYLGDMYGFLTSPLSTLESKAGPFPRLAGQVWSNKDSEGRQIVNSDDSLHDKAMEVGRYIGSIFTPISIANSEKVANSPEYKNAGPWKQFDEAADAFYGERPAPMQYSMSDAEQLAERLENERRGTMTPEQGQLADQKAQWRRAIMENPSDQDTLNRVMDAVHNYKLSQTDANSLYKEAAQAKQFPGIAGIPLHSDLQAGDLRKIWDAASDEERAQMLPTLNYRLRKISARTAKNFDQWIELARTVGAFQQNHPQTNQPSQE